MLLKKVRNKSYAALFSLLYTVKAVVMTFLSMWCFSSDFHSRLQQGPLSLVTTVYHKSFDMVLCDIKMTNDFWLEGGPQLWKCLHLARNVTKGNNVLSQSTLMDLPTISLVSPLTRETTASKATLPLTAWMLLTALQQRALSNHPPTPETYTLTSVLPIQSERLSVSLPRLIGYRLSGLTLKNSLLTLLTQQ